MNADRQNQHSILKIHLQTYSLVHPTIHYLLFYQNYFCQHYHWKYFYYCSWSFFWQTLFISTFFPGFQSILTSIWFLSFYFI